MIMLAMLTMTMAASAQFERSKTFVGASLSGLNLAYNGGDKFQIGVNAQVGTFVQDDWMVFGQVGFNHKGGDFKSNDLKLGIGGRYYIEQNGLFLGANANYIYRSPALKHNDFIPGIEIGYAFFVGGKMTIEPAIYYDQSLSDHKNYSTIGLKVGIGLYHKKKEIANSVINAFQQ